MPAHIMMMMMVMMVVRRQGRLRLGQLDQQMQMIWLQMLSMTMTMMVVEPLEPEPEPELLQLIFFQWARQQCRLPGPGLIIGVVIAMLVRCGAYFVLLLTRMMMTL